MNKSNIKFNSKFLGLFAVPHLHSCNSCPFGQAMSVWMWMLLKLFWRVSRFYHGLMKGGLVYWVKEFHNTFFHYSTISPVEVNIPSHFNSRLCAWIFVPLVWNDMVSQIILGATQKSFFIVFPSNQWELACQCTAALQGKWWTQSAQCQPGHTSWSCQVCVASIDHAGPLHHSCQEATDMGAACPSLGGPLIISPQVQNHSSRMLCCSHVMGCWLHPAQSTSFSLVSPLSPTASMKKSKSISSHHSSLCLGKGLCE